MPDNAAEQQGAASAGTAALNLTRLRNAEDIKAAADRVFEGKAVRLATSGYSAPPPGYAEATHALLAKLVSNLESVGLVTSPTADAGSIDAITSTVAQAQQVPTLYVTAEQYLGYVDPTKFPAEIDQAQFAKAEKFVFPTGEEYSKAIAKAGNSLLVTGGREVAVADFVNSVKQGNRIVLVVRTDLEGPVWDAAKNRPTDAARYLAQKLQGGAAAAGTPDLVAKGFDATFLKNHAAALGANVRVIEMNGAGDVVRVAAEASKFLSAGI